MFPVMDVSRNPFAELASLGRKSPENEAVDSTKLIEQVLLITHDRVLSLGLDGRPPCMLFVGASPTESPLLSVDQLDQVIFDRVQLQDIPQDDLIFLKSETPVEKIEDTLMSEPVTYLVACFKRASYLKKYSEGMTYVLERCEESLIRQLALLLMIDAELEQTQHGDNLYTILYDTVSSNDTDAIIATESLFVRTINQLEQDILSGLLPTELCPDSKLRVIRPLIDRLGAGLRALNPNLETSSLFANFLSSRQLVGARERALFCPQRKPLMQLALLFSRSFCTAQLLLESSFPPNKDSPQLRGQEFEAGILGRFLVPSHLHTTQPPEMVFLTNQNRNADVGEFFTDEVPLKQVVEAEQRTIWQLTDQMDEELHNLMLNLLRVGKKHVALRTLFLQWLGSCISANRARGQLSSTMNGGLLGGPDSRGLATDGFLSNLTAAIVRLTGPLIHPSATNPPLNKLWPAFASHTSPVQPAILPDLSHETRLAANLPGSGGSARSPLPSDVPLLTELFFLAHAAIRVGWTPLISRHFETAQQLHQLEAQWQAHEAAGLTTSADPQVQFLRRLIRERTSRYLEQSASLSNVTRLRDLLAFAVTTSQLLVQLARTAFGLAPTNSIEHGTLSDLPEYLVDNVVELVSYLRRAKDDFLEAAEVEQIPLEPLLEFSIVFMLHTRALANPHLRARLAEVLESLIPLRDDEAWNSQQANSLLGVRSLSFLRRQHMFQPDSGSTRSEILRHAVAALLTAFVSIELSPGTGAVGSAGSAAEVLIASASRISSTSGDNHQSDGPSEVPPDDAMNSQAADSHTATVGFEEKFQYRRPMYACLRFWHGNPFYDNQFHELESEALQHIDDVTPPLFLQFLSLLVNDAIFLLDEAISLLAQLKNKERERDAAGGRLANQQEESLFAHTGRLARHHIMLGLDTIAALRRVVSICPRLITHPILVDRIACMLNYFLARLVGPKQRDLTVRDKAAYGFRPDLLVIEICQIYNSLALESDVADASAVQAFRRAVVSDERSFTSDLLDQTDQVLHRVAASANLCEQFAKTMDLIKSENVVRMEDDLDVDDAPDEFVDPIMGHVMEDPVKLPTSGHVVDRKTIYRHLLNDSTDPFNRQPLAMAQVQPQPDLRAAIQAWISERRAQRIKPAQSGVATT
ncbi:Ubiquitin conjugation factor E4 A [Fasciola gigantica]|uniref:Ubiquitin conjugation factor E4 A n=1 Tax=Fasciola gigantica TaxID=46835 RepID=A0A504Y3W1_FASGI|nr:Ubiquitin conjugation factor E4 A [Fasciola gigantica]